jgi:hypothetical protein
MNSHNEGYTNWLSCGCVVCKNKIEHKIRLIYADCPQNIHFNEKYEALSQCKQYSESTLMSRIIMLTGKCKLSGYI